ncbi:LysR family transcriptional regulator [Escherichia coli]|uniref:LysR family transcriptional regulator n=1 Tax=Escherichia sp. MOD1-EC7003 TaxID=2093900 RepID=UPI000CF7A2A7|nr:LysR family transcriptional regulator [Escherichia sp. MOD1-EC7003]EGO8361399.1 LysR family transcriptional regulator [Escherichia coli]EGO8379083.1 LysR family transcriptional regulator [Escherichia coli]MCH0695831.1 LysR family transcriptional regulator [Escherichia coli]
MDKLAGMEMFVRVVECGSFTAAADLSDVSTTMVAKHIQAIEQRLGARLLHRTTRRQQLTEVGKLYYERCSRVLSEFALAEYSAMELQSSPKGLVQMVAPVSFGCQFLVPVLSSYMAQNPEVKIMLTLDNKIPDLTDGHYELGIHVGEVDKPNMVARPLRSYRRILAASPDYIRQHGTPEHPNQLGQFSCLGISYWVHQDRWELMGPNGETFKACIKGRFMSNLGNALRIAAVNGCGIVLQPESILMDDITQGNLVQVLPEWSYKPTPMYLIYPQDSRPSAKLRSVIDHLVKHFGTHN